jgi:hypothetical protein
MDLMRIRAHNRNFLDAINANLGTALGYKRRTGEEISNEPAIIVFVPRKINPKWLPNSQLIPSKLEGPDGLWCPLDVVEGSKAQQEDPVHKEESELAVRLRGWDEQIWAGSQVSHWTDKESGSYSMGTIGAFARRAGDNRLGFITNEHVGIGPGQRLFHPVPWGTEIGTTASVMEYIPDHEWYGPLADEPNTFVRIDCAFVELNAAVSVDDINPHMMGVGKLGSVKEIALTDMSIIGQKVLRVGRTTGLRRGTVVGFGYEFIDSADVTAYTDLLILGDDGVPFSTHGDSGSLIVTDDGENRPIGLLWGGWQSKLRTGAGQENWTYGIALSRVLDALEVDLVTEL